MKTVLLTGGLGYIGSHLVIELLKNYNVIIVDNTIHHEKILYKINQLTDKSFLFYNYDINSIHFEQVFCNHIDKVIHLAGLKSVPESVKNPLTYYDNNVSGTINLLKLMEKYNINNIIFSSTAFIYKCNEHLTELSELDPKTPYGYSKYMIEQILKDVNVNENFNCVILRYFNPIGNHPSGILTDNSHNIIPLLCKSILNDTKFIIHGNDYNTLDGTCIRDYIHVMDLVKAHLSVLDKQGFNIYNLGTGNGISVLTLIKSMENALGLKINYVYGPRRDGDLETLVCNADKIKNEIGWTCDYSINDMCRDIVTGLKL